MAEVPFFIVTVDDVPNYIGKHEIKKMWVNWGAGTTPQEAITNIQNFAKEKGYHGIIGLRFESYERCGDNMGVPEGRPRFLAYGTLVKFA